MLSKCVILFVRKCVFAGVIIIALIVCILLCINNSSDIKYIEATSAHDAYFIYNNIDCLLAGEGQEQCSLSDCRRGTRAVAVSTSGGHRHLDIA